MEAADAPAQVLGRVLESRRRLLLRCRSVIGGIPVLRQEPTTNDSAIEHVGPPGALVAVAGRAVARREVHVEQRAYTDYLMAHAPGIVGFCDGGTVNG